MPGMPRSRAPSARSTAAFTWCRPWRTWPPSTSQTPCALAYVTQTTLSVDDTRGIIAALKQRFPAITGPDVRDICYATQNRQQAVRDLAAVVDVILVVGRKNSSNSNRLREIGQELGSPAT